MKTLTQNLTLKSLAMFFGLMGLTLFVFSCAKGGNDNNNNQNLYQNCVNGYCQPNGAVSGQVFFQSQSTDLNNQMNLTLSFTTAAQMNQYPQQYPGYPQQYPQQYPGYPQHYPTYGSPITSYVGPVQAQGQLQINQGLTSYYGCVIPAGSYTVYPSQSQVANQWSSGFAQWNRGVVTNLVLQAVGPVQLTIYINPAQVSARPGSGQTWNETQPVGRLFGNIMIQAMNGMNCQYSNLIQ